MATGFKTGGRKKGVPNQNNPLKGYLRTHSLKYFQPKEQVNPDGKPRQIIVRDSDGNVLEQKPLIDSEGKPLVMSDFDVDIAELNAHDRVNAELRLLKFHTPEMKAVEVDLDATVNSNTIEDLLVKLSNEENEGEDEGK